MTVIYELASRHAARGGRTQVVVGRGTRHDYPVGEGVEVSFPPPPTRVRKGVDVALGLLGWPRPFASGQYRPALAALDDAPGGAVFLHNSPAALALFGARRGRAQICLYVHNELFRTYGRREMRRTLTGADRIICVSRFIADRLTARLGGPAANVRVVHNGVDIARFRPREDAAPPGDLVVLFVGRVVPYKGVDVLLRAAIRIAGRGRRFRVRVVGSSGFSADCALSPYELELRRIARPLGDRVEFRPFVDRDRIVDEYRAASVFCIPSTWDEPCSLTLPEALASGLPSLAARRGGIPEIAGDAVLYFDPDHVDELAERLCHLIDDASARAEWGRRARGRAQEISWDSQYERLLAALEQA